jgi:hypothetical protein
MAMSGGDTAAPRAASGEQRQWARDVARWRTQIEALRTRGTAADTALRRELGVELDELRAEAAGLAARVDAATQHVQARLAAESEALRELIAAVLVDIARVESAVLASSSEVQVQITAQLDDLRAQGDLAYEALLMGLPTHLAGEIERLEALRASASDEDRARLDARIAYLRTRTARQH